MQGHPFALRPTLVISLSLLVMIGAQAQNNVIVQANVSASTGRALLYPNSKSLPHAIKQNTRLEPENIIETGYKSRVVISLTDGSRITVLPSSRVVLKNFQVRYSPRELLNIIYGSVIVKIHHHGNTPNPYRLTSPAASIAVRGTEFIVDVRSGGETVVLVREGLVEVWPHDNPNNKRLVSRGDRVTVQPGGLISSVFPTPRRSLGSVGQVSGGSSMFFSAFTDRHMDSLDNPAYATEFNGAQGRLLLVPTVSSTHHVNKDFVEGGRAKPKHMPPFDYDISPQVTFFTPVPGSRFVVGGNISASRTRNLEVINEEYTDYVNHRINARKLNSLNTSIIAAYSFGDQGKTSVGIGVDEFSGDENLLNDYDYETSLFRGDSFYYSSARIARTRLTLGLARQLSKSMKIGFYYRHSALSSNQGDELRQKYHKEYQSDYSPEYSYFHAGKARISASSSSEEVGFRFRGSLTRKLFYGTHGSYIYERVWSRHESEIQNEESGPLVVQPISDNRYLGRRANLGAGLGFLLSSRLLLNFDLAGSLFSISRPLEAPPILGLNSIYSPPSFFASSVYSANDQRGRAVSMHVAAQANPWRSAILSISLLRTTRTQFYTYNYDGAVYSDSYKYSTMAGSLGLGWKFNPNLIAEYVTSFQYGDRAPSHAIRLRYTFNLGITNEK